MSDVHADVEDAAPLSADEEARVAEEAKRAGEDQTVGDLLKGKKGSITRAKLPKGSPSWDEIRDLTLSDVEKRARANARGFKTIAKLLKDTRFNK